MKITTKDGQVNQLLDSEDFDHPSICGQYKANLRDNSIQYVDGDDCTTSLKKVSSKRMDIRIKFDKDVKNPFEQLMKLSQRIAAQMGKNVRNIRVTSLNKDNTPPPQ